MTQQKTPSGNATSMPLRLCWRAPRTTSSPGGCGAARAPGSRACRQVLAGQRAGLASDLVGRPLGDDLSPVLAGARAEVDDVVGGADRPLVVLDHDDRVAEVAQPPQRVDQLRVVALVQADRGLVEDVEDAHQRASRSGSRAGSAAPRRPRASRRRAPATGSRSRRCPGTAGARRSRAPPGGRSPARSRSAPAPAIHSRAARAEPRVLVDVSPPTVTARLSGRSRAPPQAGQGRRAISPSIRSRVFSESVFS